MTLRTGGTEVRFKPRPVEGSLAVGVEPELLLLDGQQRTTSMFQALTGTGVVDTEDDRHRRMRRRYSVDVSQALGSPRDQDAAVRSLPEDGVVRSDFGRQIDIDVSTQHGWVAHGLMPVSTLFNRDAALAWLFACLSAAPDEHAERVQVFQDFTTKVLTPVSNYGCQPMSSVTTPHERLWRRSSRRSRSTSAACLWTYSNCSHRRHGGIGKAHHVEEEAGQRRSHLVLEPPLLEGVLPAHQDGVYLWEVEALVKTSIYRPSVVAKMQFNSPFRIRRRAAARSGLIRRC